MKTKRLDANGTKSYAIVLDDGEEVTDALRRVAELEHLGASRFTAIGAFSRAILGYFQVEERRYRKIPVDEQVEVLSLIGDITREGDEVKVHAHVVVGLADGTTRGGHLLEAHVRPTLEIMLSESPGTLERRFDERFGIPLIALDVPSR